MKKYFIAGIIIFLLIILSLIGINIYIIVFSNSSIYYDYDQLPKSNVGLVLGAGVFSDGLVSDIFADRLESAIGAYENGSINEILVSGDNGSKYYNEVIPAQNYLLSRGIPQDDIHLDYAGFDTYDSMYRAKAIFGQNELIIFTQKFHLYRSIYIADRLGIKAVGYVSDKRKYKNSDYFQLREFLSRIKAFWEAEIVDAKPKFLGEEIEIR